MKKVVIFGNGEIAEVVHYYLANDSAYKVSAFTVDKEYISSNEMLGLPVVEFETIETTFPPTEYAMFIAISYRDVNVLRRKKLEAARSKGYNFIRYVSSHAFVAKNVEIKENTFIMENNVIQPFVSIGENVIMWSGNHVGHHTTIGNDCFIASHAVISGSAKIGEKSFIGVNATIRDNICIGRSCIIGAGALILQDADDFSVYLGSRATLSRAKSNRIKRI